MFLNHLEYSYVVLPVLVRIFHAGNEIYFKRFPNALDDGMVKFCSLVLCAVLDELYQFCSSSLKSAQLHSRNQIRLHNTEFWVFCYFGVYYLVLKVIEMFVCLHNAGLSNNTDFRIWARYKPDVIKGDMDSIRTEVLAFYANLVTIFLSSCTNPSIDPVIPAWFWNLWPWLNLYKYVVIHGIGI